jgi:hypothetical protein
MGFSRPRTAITRGSRVIVQSQVWQALVGCRRVLNVEPCADCFQHDRAFSVYPRILGRVIDA